MRLIDADALNYVRVRIYHDDGTIGGYTAIVPSSEIRNAPTIEAAPAIQCKDCQGYDEGRCHWWYDDPEVPATGYCFQAEKKETEGNNGGR